MMRLVEVTRSADTMRRTWLFLLIILLTSASYTARADDEGWEVVERCFGEATTPPEGWTFDGTLLMTSTGRLHAYRQEWETPRILVFHTPDIPYSGLLSPNGLWYAVIEGRSEQVQVVTGWYTEAIHVYSTNSDEKYTSPWISAFAAVHTLHGHGLYWLDNEHLLYSREDSEGEEWFSINPFSGEILAWESPFTPSWDVFMFSPDSKKAFYGEWGGLAPRYFHNGIKEIELPVWNTIWHPDSTDFVAHTINEETYRPDQLALFDLDGNISDILIDIPEGADTSTYYDGWSPDGRYLLTGADANLYLADFHNSQLIDTCVPLNNAISVAWSPSNQQFAFINARFDDRRIQIFDLAAWERYVVGYHSGSLIGWRVDD